MSQSKRFYISTAIHYVNDLPHIGHVYENVVADVTARYHRMLREEVFFLTGTDEHGQKIERSAAKEGISPIELADRVANHHLALWKTLGISNDDFIRTTESRHRVGVYEIIRRIQEKSPGDIYLGEHSGWYCSNEEAFFPESQIVDGKCENGHAVERTTEKNYFFKLSAYTDRLLRYYNEHPEFVFPPTRFNEVVSFVQGGLKDLSISRTSINWGIPFPGDPQHVIYVWLDALTNYISALGFGSAEDQRFENFWPADVHLIGKDIVRFHAVYWPAFLMAAGIELPKSVVAHGWWLRDNQKISKSTGNIVRPHAIIEQFGADAFRYYMLRDMVFGQDASYSDEAFVTRYNSDLANDFGNTLSRLLKMTSDYFEGKTPPTDCGVNDVRDAVDAVLPDYHRAMSGFAFQRALDVTWKLIDAINQYIVTREPWKRYKQEGASRPLARILWDALEGLRIVCVMLHPFMPQISSIALERMGADRDELDERALQWGGLGTGVPVTVSEPLFPRIDTVEFLKQAREEKQATVNPIKEEKKEVVTTHPGETTPPAQTTEAIAPDANLITIDEFFRAELRVAKILSAEKVEKSKKLMKLRVDTGDEERTIVAGIATKYSPEELTGRKVVIVANLKPAKLMGIESQGMVLAASIDGEPSLVAVDEGVPVGTKVK